MAGFDAVLLVSDMGNSRIGRCRMRHKTVGAAEVAEHLHDTDILRFRWHESAL